MSGDGQAARQYAAAGVDLEGAEAAKARIDVLVASTRTALSTGAVGGFGGMVRVPAGLRRPVIVMSTDGVGTKVMVARQLDRWDTVGEDLVNHSVNDILVHGAAPLAFMDYIAGAGLTTAQVAGIVEGIARGCRAHDMALAGGETAQMPGLYRHGDYDLAGTIIGVVEEDEALHGERIVPGDALVGLASTGLHTNGYTLARRVLLEVAGLSLHDELPGTGTSVGDALLAVHRSYVAALRPVFGRVHGLAHITGGGIGGNLVRVLRDGVEAVVQADSWTWPALFRTIQARGGVGTDEMREVFNLGCGMVVACAPGDVAAVRASAAAAGVDSWEMGAVRAGPRTVTFA
ncbi:MAG: phosphoribosylformylglycinamidine cyclo-ligase [Gemmatimonadales bacterium]|nr:phosphoribosylformylglycinamidine cyclo-ligase [Gemmatimonadales bacterium]